MNSSNQDTKDELVGIIHKRFAAFKADDIPGLDRNLTNDATLWDVFIPNLIRGGKDRQRYRQADQGQMRARGTLTISIEQPVIDVWQDAAVARYYLEYSYEAPNPTSDRVRITDVFRRIEGNWMIVHHHEGAVPTGIPPIRK